MKSELWSYSDFFIEKVSNHNPYNMDFHQYHDVYEIFLMLDGERYIFCKDSFYTLTRGDVLIISPFVLHFGESRNSDFYERYVMNFSPAGFSCIFTPDETKALTSRLSTRLLHLDEEQLKIACHYFVSAHEHHRDSSSISKKLLYANLAELINYLYSVAARAVPKSGTRLPDAIITAIHYMNDHYAENISLDRLAELVHISKYHFCRMFHKSTGTTFLAHLHHIRLAAAHRLISESDIPLAQIASKTGFSSPSHLAKMFAEEYGITPGALRRKKTS